MEKFVRAIKVATVMIAETKRKDPMCLTSNEEYAFNCSNKCHICDKEFNDIALILTIIK